jgi:hypothetical protein
MCWLAITQFVCGACSLDGSQIEAANQLLFDGWQKVDATGNVPFNARVLDPMRNMFELRSRLKCGQQMGLLTCLWMTRDTLATDRRDYLFAKLGMMGEKASSLCMPNYYKSLHEIDLRFLQAYIRSEGDLYIICHAGMAPRANGKASWVPDWGSSRPAYPLRCSWSGSSSDWPSYDAAGGSLPVVDFPEDYPYKLVYKSPLCGPCETNDPL